MGMQTTTKNTESYKETELGWLPESWDVVKFEDIGKFQYGYTETSSTKKIGPKFLRITDIDLNSSRIFWETVPYCKIIKEEFPKYELGNGDILIARIGATTGKTCIIRNNPPESVFASYLIRFSCDKQKILSDYCYFFMTGKLYWEQINANKEGKLKKGVSSSQLKKFKITLPPIPEQQKIAHVLSTIQTAQEKIEAVITAHKELKKAMMKHLFTYGPVSLEEAKNVKVKETEIGLVPEEWDVVKLGDIANFKNGINFNREQKGNIGILTIDVLNMYGGLYVNLNNLYRINKNVGDDYLLDEGDILFVRSSLKQEGVGWTSLFKEIDEPVTYCGFIIRARLKRKDSSPEFFTNFLRTEIARKNLIASSGKVAITNINQGMLGRILIPVPSFSIQQQISSILSTVDQKIEIEKIKKNSLDELFKSMLHNLMTAKIRVNELVIPNEKNQ